MTAMARPTVEVIILAVPRPTVEVIILAVPKLCHKFANCNRYNVASWPVVADVFKVLA